MNPKIKELYVEASILFEEKKYAEVVKVISGAQPESQNSGALLILLADSLYELRNDLGALEIYVKYVDLYPMGRALQFALFNSSICLKNLGLELEARQILELVSKKHPGIESEISDSDNRILAFDKAKECVEKIVKSLANADKGAKTASLKK